MIWTYHVFWLSYILLHIQSVYSQPYGGIYEPHFQPHASLNYQPLNSHHGVSYMNSSNSMSRRNVTLPDRNQLRSRIRKRPITNRKTFNVFLISVVLLGSLLLALIKNVYFKGSINNFAKIILGLMGAGSTALYFSVAVAIDYLDLPYGSILSSLLPNGLLYMFYRLGSFKESNLIDHNGPLIFVAFLYSLFTAARLAYYYSMLQSVHPQPTDRFTRRSQ